MSEQFGHRQESDEESIGPSLRFGKGALIMVGMAIGIVASLYYAWVLEPVVYVAASPARLNDFYKQDYLLLISESYANDGDWEAAQRRLEALDDPELEASVNQELEAFLRRGESASRMRNMAALAKQLGVDSVAIGIFVPELAETNTPTPTIPPTPIRTRLPTRTPAATSTSTPSPAPTLIPKYRLLSQEQVCEDNNPSPRIEVVVIDSASQQVPGIEVIVQSTGGVDHFFTGFQPEKGSGYGDFDMGPDVTYQVYLRSGSPIVENLKIENCLELEGGWPGGWRLTFQNTNVPSLQEPEEEN